MPEPSRKPLDSRISSLIQRCASSHHRGLIVMVGSPKEQHLQIVNLHFLQTSASASLKKKPAILWTYSKNLGFTSNRKKREGKQKREVQRGIREDGDLDPFSIWLGIQDIRFSYYKDVDSILGRTFGMAILSDFQSLTPNLLAKTIETVEGGGLVVLLLQNLTSLKQLYTMTMDVHARYRTSQSDADPIARFNERFILSLGACQDCLVVDDELNVLPISSSMSLVKQPPASAPQDKELSSLIDNLSDSPSIAAIIKQSKTLDQAKAVLTFTEAITSKKLSSTVALTAARGRGKSAALGLSVALAVAHSYSNIFVTSPSPENLKTLFEFLFTGLEKLGYQEHLDYDILTSTNPDWNGAVVRVNIHRDHRQTIQYIQPNDHAVLGQAELIVIDEAAAIPLPVVRKLLGPYLVFIASTINGYEGTGRSLSLKLLQQLRESASSFSSTDGGLKKPNGAGLARSFKEIKLGVPIRYSPGDRIEEWLNKLLCLDATVAPILHQAKGMPLPSDCELVYVDRDTLFSFHPASELFLQRMMALYVASHYKNSPNDLQLMSDAPAHALYALLPPLREDDTTLPEPLVVMQVALEGRISKQSVLNSLKRGIQAAGDLIPWTMAQQFQDEEFASLSGARIVRIAVHPEYSKMGYGTRALQALDDFYRGKVLNLDEELPNRQVESLREASKVDETTTLLSDQITVRDAAKMPPLLHRLSDRKPEALDYLGVSYGLTLNLLRFWKRSGFVPLYMRQTTNSLTGEYTCIQIKPLHEQEGPNDWLTAFAADFRKRFITLSSYSFRSLSVATALTVLGSSSDSVDHPLAKAADYQTQFSHYDMKRLKSYANNMTDYHVILDLLPSLAALYFTQQFPTSSSLSALQASLLSALGLQRKTVEEVEAEINLPVNQCLAILVKIIRKLYDVIEQTIVKDFAPPAVASNLTAISAAQVPRGNKEAFVKQDTLTITNDTSATGAASNNENNLPLVPKSIVSLLTGNEVAKRKLVPVEPVAKPDLQRKRRKEMDKA